MATEIIIKHSLGVTPVLVGQGLLGGLGGLVTGRVAGLRAAVISDDNVEKLYLEGVSATLKEAGFKVEAFVFPAGEATKSFASLEILLTGLLDFGIERGDCIVALGGGVVGDLAGLAASLLKRGVHLVQVPTTLLSEVDSAIGGKTGINTRHGKNLIGSIWQPQLVVADVDALKTLPDREFRSGYAEVVKHAVLEGEAAFRHLEDTFAAFFANEPGALIATITSSVKTKAAILEGDEREAGRRMVLNLGHSFGHALELLGEYSKLSHGEAVAIGMVAAFEFSHQSGKAKAADLARLRGHLEKAGLPTKLEDMEWKLSGEDILSAMGHDKKRTKGGFRLVVPYGFGEAGIEEVSGEVLDGFLKTSATLGR